MPKSKRTKNKINLQNRLKDKLKKINSVLAKFENEVEKAVGTVRQQSKRSGDTLMKVFDEVIQSIGATEIKNKAFEKRDELKKEIKKLSDDITSTIKNFEFQFDQNIISKLRKNTQSVFSKIQDSEIFEYAKGKVSDTKNQVFTLLQIPSQVELDNLARKISRLEKKLKIVSQHKRAA